MRSIPIAFALALLCVPVALGQAPAPPLDSQAFLDKNTAKYICSV